MSDPDPQQTRDIAALQNWNGGPNPTPFDYWLAACRYVRESQPADRMPSSVNQKQADLGATAAAKEATQEDRGVAAILFSIVTKAMDISAPFGKPVVEWSFNVEEVFTEHIRQAVARATERLREENVRLVVLLKRESLRESPPSATEWVKAASNLAEAVKEDSVSMLRCDLAGAHRQIKGQSEQIATVREERDELRKALEEGRSRWEDVSQTCEHVKGFMDTLSHVEIRNHLAAIQGRAHEELRRLALNADSRPASVPKEAIDSALTRHEDREGQQKSDPVGTQDGIKGEGESLKAKIRCLVGYIEYMLANPRLAWPNELQLVVEEANEFLSQPATPQASLRNPTQGQP